MAQLKPSMKSFGQALTGQKLKSTYINPSAFTSRTAGMGAPGMSSPGAFSAVEVNELTAIKKNLTALLAIEKKYTDFLGDKILKFARNEEKTKLKKKESSQETKDKKEKKAKDNPIVKGAMKGLDGLVGFFGDLFKWFIGYKIVEWVSKPENTKKIKDFANLFLGIFKFVSNVVGFGIDKLMSGLSHLVDGNGITRVFGALEMIVGFFTLKWLLNPTKIISDIKMIGTLFTKVIPNTINGILNFFTNLIPSAVTQAADTAVTEGLKGAADAGKEAAKTGARQVTEQAAKTGGKAAAETVAKGTGKAAAKGAAKVSGKSLLKKLPVIGAVAGGAFAVDRASKGDWLGAGMEVASGAASLLPGWGTAASLGIDAALVARDLAKEKEKEDKKLPKLAKGGIVTKPTKAIVGEAGPEAILPLDKLSSFTGKGFDGDIGKIIPKFMKMLTIPFTLVGSGIIALMSSSLSMIPGLGPLMIPLISSIASTFGIPTSIVKGVSKFVKNPVKALASGANDIAKIFGGREPRISKQKGNKFSPSQDTSVRGLLANILGALASKNSESSGKPSGATPASGGAAPGTPSGGSAAPSGGASGADTAKESLKKAGGLREDGTLKGVQGQEKVIANTRGGGTTKEYSPGGGLKPVINGDRKFWYNSAGDVFKWEKPGDPLTDITSSRLFDSNAIGGPLVRIPSTGEVKILKGMFGSDQTAVGMYNYELGKILKARGKRHPRSGAKITDDVWETPAEGKYGKPAKFIGGGKVGGSGVGDKIPALLEPNEYVLNKNLAQAMGGPTVLDKLNFNTHPRFGSAKISQQIRHENKASGDGRPKTRKFQIGGAAILEGAKKIAGMGRGQANMCAATTRAALKAAGHPAASKVTGKGDLDAEGTKYNGLNFAASFAGSDMGSVVKQVSALQAGDIVLWKGGNGYNSGAITHVGIKGEGNDLWHHGRSAGFRKASMYTSSNGQTFAAGIRLGGAGTIDGATPDDSSKQETGATWGQIAKDLSDLYKGLTKTTPSTSTPAPSPSPSVPASSSRLQQAQQASNQAKASQRIAATSASKPGGNVVSLSQGTNVVNQSTVETLAPALGNTIPPTPLTIFPTAP